MKKESFLFIFAGFVLGSSITFVTIKTIDQYKEKESQRRTVASTQDQNLSIEDMNEEKHFEMMQNFIKSAKENPQDIDSRITLGNIYYEKGKFKEAIYWYEEALKIDPKNTEILVDLGASYRSEDPKKSIEFFDRALSIDPKKQQALYNKVVVYLFDLKDIASAKESLKNLEAHYPQFPMLNEIKKEIEAAEIEK